MEMKRLMRILECESDRLDVGYCNVHGDEKINADVGMRSGYVGCWI